VDVDRFRYPDFAFEQVECGITVIGWTTAPRCVEGFSGAAGWTGATGFALAGTPT
jgi:hypothetical protein